MSGWAVFGLGLFCLYFWLASMAFQRGLVTHVFGETLLWSLAPYLCAFLLIDRTLHVPPVEGNSLVGLAAFIPFAVLLGVVVAFHLEYSRGALLLAYVTTLLWLTLGYRRFVKHYLPVFGYVDERARTHLDEMLRMPGAAQPGPALFRHIATLDEAAHCDGLMMDRFSTTDPERTRTLARFKLSHVRIYSVERVGELLTGRVGLSHIDENFLDDHGQHYLYAPAKRAMDVLCVLLMTPLALPLSLLVALAIRLESTGPVLFRQQRVGLYGKPFMMFKFRSMAVSLSNEARFASEQDPRITRVGRIIRKYRLDEIPQLWNVLTGQMSMIGPRPEQVPMVESFSDSISYYPYRHLVRPGLSGWAQVQQGYAGDHEETMTKLSYDLYYVKHCSLALDLLIAAKTLRTLLTGHGAR
jgi:exopolysaccharide biosynthesis polyprenyl glycosylphosphotransferase